MNPQRIDGRNVQQARLGNSRRLGYVAGPLVVDGFVQGLVFPAQLNTSGGMDYRADPLHGRRQGRRIAYVSGGEFDIQRLERPRITLFSHQDADFDPPLDEQTCYVIADQSRGASHQHAGPCIAIHGR